MKIIQILINFLTDWSLRNPRGKFKWGLRLSALLMISLVVAGIFLSQDPKFPITQQGIYYAVATLFATIVIAGCASHFCIVCPSEECATKIYSHMPWICPCTKENSGEKRFSFLYQCRYCGYVPLGYLCDKCGYKIPLGKEQDGIQEEHCAKKGHLAGESVTVKDFETTMRDPQKIKMRPPKPIFDDLTDVDSVLNKVIDHQKKKEFLAMTDEKLLKKESDLERERNKGERTEISVDSLTKRYLERAKELFKKQMSVHDTEKHLHSYANDEYGKKSTTRKLANTAINRAMNQLKKEQSLL